MLGKYFFLVRGGFLFFWNSDKHSFAFQVNKQRDENFNSFYKVILCYIGLRTFYYKNIHIDNPMRPLVQFAIRVSIFIDFTVPVYR